MNRKKITAWVTKYALTIGIMEVEGRISEVSDDTFVYGEHDHLAFKNGWFRTEVEAAERAAEMRNERIKSLKKSLAKMENLKIKIVKRVK